MFLLLWRSYKYNYIHESYTHHVNDIRIMGDTAIFIEYRINMQINAKHLRSSEGTWPPLALRYYTFSTLLFHMNVSYFYILCTETDRLNHLNIVSLLLGIVWRHRLLQIGRHNIVPLQVANRSCRYGSSAVTSAFTIRFRYPCLS